MILFILQNYFPDWIVTNLFRYISFRALLSALIAFIFVVVFMPRFVRFFHRLKTGQIVRDDGPQTHLKKTGTPTMGGLLIVWAVVLVSSLFCRLSQPGVLIILVSFVATAGLGFADDYLKLAKKNTKGVSSRLKILVLACISTGTIFWALQLGLIESKIYVPFFKDISLWVGPWFYLWGFFVIAGASNSVNLTDGLDGLAIVPVMTTSVVFILISYVSGHALFSEYLQFRTLPGAGEYGIILSGVLGAGLGFLWFNSHPAEVFMGDVGSLSLGALLATISLLLHQEMVLLIAGFIFVMEAISVMLQVGFYKSTKKRVFRMAPIHHHFELLGWAESKVIVRFWILSIIFAVLALTTLKLR